MIKLASRIAVVSLFVLFTTHLHAQSRESGQHAEDSVHKAGTLAEVVISAFEQNKKQTDQPAAVFYLDAGGLSRFSHTGILTAINTIPGVTMQQRSPQSFRLDIRGSALRSPFGVRNVKIYYDGIPLTDPGGNTYLNELGFDDVGNLTVIKGPAGSLYGAGTGGVVLINSPLFSHDTIPDNFAKIELEAGSYGLRKWSAGVLWQGNSFRYSETKSHGYRDQTAVHSRIASYEAKLKNTASQQLAVIAHYTDLSYETPGALTSAEFKRNPRASRPASGIYPSASQNAAAVHQKNFLVGIREQYHFSNQLQASAVLYGAYTDFINPTVRNYEFRKEPHFGGRLVLQRQQWIKRTKLVLTAGAEAQQGYFNVTDHENNQGAPAGMMNDDNINTGTALAFIQGDIMMPKGWEMTVAASYHRSGIVFKQLYPEPFKSFKTTYDQTLSPRIGLSRHLSGGRIIFLNASSGFSPPTVSELLPSTSQINTSLRAEKGISYDIGSRGFLIGRNLYYDVDAFIFNLKNSISLRRDSSGADYFVNAGGTRQHGVEAYLAYTVMNRSNHLIKCWTSASWFDFSYRNYLVADKNYSGKKLPGVSPVSFSAGVDVRIGKSLASHLVYTYGHRIPLNDANDVYSAPYHLMDINLNYECSMGDKTILTVFGGLNNALNQTYSLGDDINAAGGRYFNVAPAINFYAGISLKYGK